MKLTSIAFVILCSTAFAQTKDSLDASGESVEILTGKALEAYKAGKAQEAIAFLQKAINKIQSESSKDLVTFLPPVPEGFTADEPRTSSGNWGAGGQSVQVSTVERTYWKKDAGLRITVTFTNSPQLIMPQRQMLKMFENEQMMRMMNMDPNKEVKPVKKDGWNGWTQVDKGKAASGIAISDALMVNVQVNKDRKDVLQKFWDRVDFKGLLTAK